MATKSGLWQRLRAARTAADKTQGEVAKHFGLTRPAVSFWETAKDELRTQPTAEQIRQLAELFGVSTGWLLDNAADPDDVWRNPSRVRVGPQPSSPAAPAAANTNAAASFWSAVRYAVQAQLPTYASSFDIVVPAGHSRLDVPVPFMRGGHIVAPAALDRPLEDVLRSGIAQLLLAERATGRKARLHLAIWAPAGVEVDSELTEAAARTWGVSVTTFAGVDAASTFLLNL